MTAPRRPPRCAGRIATILLALVGQLASFMAVWAFAPPTLVRRTRRIPQRRLTPRDMPCDGPNDDIAPTLAMSIDTNSNVEDVEYSRMFALLRPPPSCLVDRMSATELAYMGDVVYELFVRSRMVWPPQRTSDRQETAVALVRAEHQSKLLAKLRNNFELTLPEQQILKRGRNAASSRNHNRRNPAVYQDSTALEALLGYLYIAHPDRCHTLLQWMDTNIDSV